MMKRYKLTISYDGTGFAGYQIQPAGRTVQGEIERCLSVMHKGGTVPVSASGRTDAGVHARGQVLHFDSSLAIEPKRWIKALNALLPADIRVLMAEEAESGFHSRFSAEGKEYVYKVNTSLQGDVFQRNYTCHFPYVINADLVQDAIPHFLGTHDFTSFCSARSEVEDKIRTITSLDLDIDGDDWTFTIRGNGFLYNMVRIIIGTLLEVGQGKIAPADIPVLLKAKDRTKTGKTAPAHGLYLNRVFYGQIEDKYS
ncbi:tRNA pseudouridine(38-40) synthase TruA [Fictibacillus aquaticus]|uniref:tRNA pseudouridine synthase A n=1 Tax=Fictibacillus aquaticus TaxID=2021314 RepID=A0A235F7R1_9BACL|nr:tRNA pseudouridine(38-40) synthase TruA [Fictibacillus aquaticus]